MLFAEAPSIKRRGQLSYSHSRGQRMRTTWKTLPSVILALLAAAPGTAQRFDGIRFTSPLSLSGGHDENFIAGDGELDDTVYLFNAPTLSVLKNTHSTDFAVNYQPEFEFFSRHPGQNSWNHRAMLRWRQRLNARWSLEAGDSFLSTKDPSRQLADSLYLLPRGRFQQNAVFAAVDYKWDRRTTMGFRFDNGVTTMALPGARSGLFDQIGGSATVSLERVLTRRHTLGGSYAVLYVRPLDRQTAAAPGLVDFYKPAHTINLDHTFKVNSGLILVLSGGAIRGHQFSYRAGALVEKRFGPFWAAAGYQRYLAFFGGITPTMGLPPATTFASGVLPGSIYEVGSFRIRGRLTRRLGLEMGGLRARSEVQNRDRDTKSVIGHFRLSHKLTKQFSLFTEAEFYGQNMNEFLHSQMSRKRFFGGLEIVLMRPPEPARVPKTPPDTPQVPEEER
jgi:hypothetical protein